MQAGAPSARRPGPTVWRIMLGSAASVFAGSALLVGIGALLLLIFALDNDAEVAYSIGLGAQLVSYLVLIAAFVMACVALWGRDERREGRLTIGAIIAAGGFFALLAFYEIFASVDATHDFSGTGVASDAALGAGALFLLIAAVFAAVGGASVGPGLQWRRDARRVWASISLAVGFALLMTGEILTAVTGASIGSFFGLSSAGSVVTAAGWGIGIGAGVTAAVGFLISRQRRSHDGARLRDLLLAVASVVLAVAFLLTGIGGMLRASAVSDLAVGAPPGSGFGQVEAYFWLVGVGQLVLMVGATCGAIGFFLAFRSRRAPSRPLSTQVPTAAPTFASPIPEGTQAGSTLEPMATNGLAQECAACGYQNRSESAFCRSCGTRLVRQGA
jgi:hypothetical protein